LLRRVDRIMKYAKISKQRCPLTFLAMLAQSTPGNKLLF
jgi:hypothetical protein